MSRQELDYDTAIKQLRTLPEDKQRAVLGRLSPDRRKEILAHLTAPAPPIAKTGGITDNRTAGEVASDQAASVLKGIPQAVTGIPAMVESLGSAGWDILQGKGTSKAQDILKGMLSPVTTSARGAAAYLAPGSVEAPSREESESAAEGAGANLGGIVVSEAVPAIGKVIGERATLGTLRDLARRGIQSATKSGSFNTSESMFDKVSKQQVESDTNVAEKNRQNVEAANKRNVDLQSQFLQDTTAAEEAAKKKTAEQQGKATAKNEMAVHEADIKTDEAKAAHAKKVAEQNAAHAQAVKETAEHNAKAAKVKARTQELDDKLNEGSPKLGRLTKDFEAKTKSEADEKYAPIHAAMEKSGDGESLLDIASGAKNIEKENIKGSSENIKQFRDLIKKSKEAEGNDFLDNLDKTVTKIEKNPDDIVNLPYDQIKGYYSEITTKLAQDRGKMSGDVRQSLKKLGSLMRKSMIRMEERNGVGPQGREASAYWSARQDLLYSKKGALSQVRQRIGVLDPEHLSEPFTKGKSAGIAIDKLRKLPTKYSSEANALADLAGQLKSAYTERRGVKPVLPKEVPAAPPDIPAPGRTYAELAALPEPVSAASQTAPKPVMPEIAPKKTIPAPTAEDIVNAKKHAVRSTGVNIGSLSKYDIAYPAEILAGVISGHPIIGALLHPIAKFTASYILQHPAIVESIAKLTTSDLAAVEKLPEPQQTQVRTNLKAIIDKENAAGRKIKVSPAVGKFIEATGAASGTIQNRRDALKALGKDPDNQ